MEDNTKISLIVAVDEKNGIGKAGPYRMLWHIPEDLKRFKEITTGHVVIMGRNTLESMGGPLLNRVNVVITRDLAYKNAGVIIVHSLEEAIEVSREHEKKGEIFIIGGGQIFEQAIRLADKLYLTKIKGDFRADTFFPNYSNFKKTTFQQEGESNGYSYRFLELEK